MGITDCGEKIFRHVRSEATLNAYSGKKLAVDVASFKLKAWYGDVAQYWRSSEPQSHGYRAQLSKLLSALAMATGATSNVVVCLDGGRFPPKSREHTRRGATVASRADILKDAAAKDSNGEHKEGNRLYQKLVYPVPPLVDGWLIAHCREHGFPLVVAPQEADSQAAQLVRDGQADILATNDSDLLFYPGVQELLLAGAGRETGTWWRVKLEDIVGKPVGTLSFEGFGEYDVRSVAIACGCDYAPRVYGKGWKSLVDLYTGLVEATRKFGEPALREAFIIELVALNERQGEHAHQDYEPMLRAAYEAFENPVAWQLVAPAGIAWPAVSSDLTAVRLVGAAYLCSSEVKSATAEQALALCRGDVHARAFESSTGMVLPGDEVAVLQTRELPDLADLATAEDAHVPIIQPSERGRFVDGTFEPGGLRKYKKDQLIAWLTAKLQTPISPEVRDTMESLYTAVSRALEIEEEQGAEAFAPVAAMLGALGNWTMDDGTVQRRPEQALTDLPAIFEFVREKLPPMDDKLANKYIPVSFESTYKRAFSNVNGGCVLNSMKALQSESYSNSWHP